MSFQKTILCGEIITDPELRWNQAGVACCAFRLKTAESWIGPDGSVREDEERHRVLVWGKDAERISKDFKKGHLVVVEGRNKTRAWKSENGVTIDITEVVAVPNGVRFCGGAALAESRPARPEAFPAPRQDPPPESAKQPSPAAPEAAVKEEKPSAPKKKTPIKAAAPKPDKVPVDLAVADDLPF
jgi:single stranded DNA-binding protein